MRRIILALVLLGLSMYLHGQIIADHTVVDKYDQIPQEYIDEVKTMLVNISGLSHQSGYTNGLLLLEKLDTKFQAYTYYQGIPGPTSQYLRLGKHNNIGQEQFYTTQDSIEEFKAHLTSQNTTGNPYDVLSFAWCWDMHWINDVGGSRDPVYNVRWAGTTEGGPDGNKIWGLDSGDSILTGNRVSMDTYLDAIEQYIEHCSNNGYPTNIIFATGPVDNYFDDVNGTEKGFQRELKNDHIRDYVASDPSRILFDYADILCWSNAGEKYMASWDDNGNIRPHANIHPENEMDYDESWNMLPGSEDGDHIGEVGALRLGKAMWWLLARIAGWDGTVNGEDTTPPSTPADLVTNSVSESSIEISWTASDDNVGVTGYNVYRDGALLGNSATTSYSDNTVVACTDYTYTVTAMDAAGNESNSSEGLTVSSCAPDLTPTLIVTPNISHGVTNFDVIVRVTELNLVQTTGEIVVQIPIDSRWELAGSFDQTLTMLDGIPLDNSDWSYSSDATNHIFTSMESVLSGGFSAFGFTITFDPDVSRGAYTITSQLVSGAGGETRISNNTDSERLNYFQ